MVAESAGNLLDQFHDVIYVAYYYTICLLELLS